MNRLLKKSSRSMIAALLGVIAGYGTVVRADHSILDHFIDVYLFIEEIECPDGSTSGVRARWVDPQGEQTIPVTRTGGSSWRIEVEGMRYNNKDKWLWRDLEDSSYKVVEIEPFYLGFVVDSPLITSGEGYAFLRVGDTWDIAVRNVWIDDVLQIQNVYVTVSELDDSDCDGIPDIEDTPGPTEQIEALIAEINGLVNVQKAIKNSLVVKLNAALVALSIDDTATACASLQDFINEAQALQGRKLATNAAASLIEEAQAIRSLIGCP